MLIIAISPNAAFSVVKPHFPVWGLRNLSQRMVSDYFTARCESDSAYEGSLTFSQKSMKKKRECVEEGSCSDTFCQRV